MSAGTTALRSNSMLKVAADPPGRPLLLSDQTHGCGVPLAASPPVCRNFADGTGRQAASGTPAISGTTAIVGSHNDGSAYLFDTQIS